MAVPTIFEICRPREDVRAGAADADFAADLASVVNRTGSAEYHDPARFFANTYATRGLKNLLSNVCRRLSGAGGDVASIFRLDTSYGGGKTHGLIALAHAARVPEGVEDFDRFVDPAVLPKEAVRVAVFDGENADPANGRDMGEGLLAYTPWGELAYALGGHAGFERVRESDRQRIAPGAGTLRELFGGRPALLLLDELSVYLRKVRDAEGGRDQLTAFLTSLFKAVEGTPNVALVYTLAVGKGGQASDAYADENSFIADQMQEAEKVSARKATLLNPTEQDETVQVLRRRLFERIDDSRAAEVASAYAAVWKDHAESLAPDAVRPETRQLLADGYPFHPEVLETLIDKTATLETFQRVRGMLRLLARTIHHLWETRPDDATAIHVHHVDPGRESIRQEIVTRLGQSAYVPAIDADVSSGKPDAAGGRPGVPSGRPDMPRGRSDMPTSRTSASRSQPSAPGGKLRKKSLAQQIDADHHRGLPPYAEYAARTIFLHTLAYNDPLKGLSPADLRYSVLGPATDLSFIEGARKKFVAESAYLDDRPGSPMRFLAEANLTQIVRREERNVDAEEVRAQLNDGIRRIFEGKTLEAVCFPGGPHDVADEAGESRPKLVVISPDAVALEGTVDGVPGLIDRIYSRKGSDGSALRLFRNSVVFVAADESRCEEMRDKVRRRLALRELKKPERLEALADHQRTKVREWAERSEADEALSIQQCYRHVFYPSRNRVGDSMVDLAHTAIDAPSTSDRPGAGQQQVVRVLRDLTKLRLVDDEPDSPAYVRDRTPLRRGEMTTRALRNEFRRDPSLPILVGDEVFVQGVRTGVEQGDYVYRSGDLLYGPGDPAATIRIDEQSIVHTMTYAKNKGVWPRPEPEPKEAEGPKAADQSVLGTEFTPTDRLGAAEGGEEPSAAGPFEVEAPFREAVVRVWEQARDRGCRQIEKLAVRVFQADEALRVMSVVGSLPGATKTVALQGSYETRDGGSLELEFAGSIEDADPVKEFLRSQMRAATRTSLDVRYELTFGDGLTTDEDGSKMIIERLSRFVSGSTVVSATGTEEG